jgi:hypothetical protein
MAKSRTEQIAPLSGAAFVVLLIVSWLLINNYEYQPPGGEIKEFLTDNSTRVAVGAYLGVVASILLMWFSGSLREALRVAEGGTGRVSAIAFGGGVAGGAVSIVAYAGLMSAATRAGDDLGISVGGATALWDLTGNLIGVGLPMALAAMIGGAAVVAFRTGVLPTWVAWASAIFAVGSLSPLSYVFIAADVLWILYVSIVLYNRGRAAATA